MAADETYAARHGDRHLLSDMDASLCLVSRERSLAMAPLTKSICTPTGHPSLGMFAALIDVAASDPAMILGRPDWTATQELALHGAASLTVGPMAIDTRLVRGGKKLVVVAADVYDGRSISNFDVLKQTIDAGAATLVASGLVTFARLPHHAAPGMDDYDPGSWVGHVRHRAPPGPVLGTIHERMGIKVVDAERGELELDLTPYVRNSIGTINGGAQAVLIEAAAEAMRPGMVATDLQIHFLAQLNGGPARTRTTLVRDTSDHSVVEVDIVDAGADNTVLTLATVTLTLGSYV